MAKHTTALLLAILMVASGLVVTPAGATVDEEDRWGPGNNYDYRYIMVAPKGWKDELQPLLDWRERTLDYNVSFLALEDALATGQGRDKAARLKDAIGKVITAIRGYYALVLVGDAEVIPVRYVFTDILQDGNVSDPLNLRWTDDYYGVGTEADWDKDGDGVYGEDGEVLSEVTGKFLYSYPFDERWMVGRIPASNELETERFVAKLLAYERSPPPGDWYTSALLMSGLMDVPNHLDDPYTPWIDGGYELFSDNAYESHERLVELLPEGYDVTWLSDYPRLDGGAWNRSVDTLDHASAVAAFDKGHSVVAMNGHGWIDGSGLAQYNGSGYSTFWWDWQDAYTYADADNATNGGMLPWVYVAACYVGDVTVPGDRTLERMVMNPSGGAVGMVAGNGENYKGESMANGSYGNWFLERYFWSRYFEYGPGMALLYAKRAYLSLVHEEAPRTPLLDAYYVADYLSHNLLGDPMTRVWTDVPQQLEIGSVEDAAEYGDAVRVRVTDGSGAPVEGARVHVSHETGWKASKTDGKGEVVLSFPLSAPEVRVTASKPNYLPAEVTTARPVEGPDPRFDRVYWYDYLGDWGKEIHLGDQVAFSAYMVFEGRYDQELARVRFSVAQGEGAFARLIPDEFIELDPLWDRKSVFKIWTTPAAGLWRVRIEVDPEKELPDEDRSNNVAEFEVRVRGPPQWRDLPDSVLIECGDAPGGTYDLMAHVEDPDSSPGELLISAVEATGNSSGPGFSVDAGGRLQVCTQQTFATLELVLNVTDGDYWNETTLTVNVTRDGPVPRLRITGETHHTAVQGDVVHGRMAIEDLGPGPAGDVAIVPLVVDADLIFFPDGTFEFQARTPGVHAIELAIQRPDGTSDPRWEGALLVIEVSPGPGDPPMLLDWPEARIVEGERATFQLLAIDPEGGAVTYSLEGPVDLGAEVDPVTGLLTLRPAGGSAGKHEVVVRVSDGTKDDLYILYVRVTEAPETSSAWMLAVAVVAVVAIAVSVSAMWFAWTRRRPEGG